MLFGFMLSIYKYKKRQNSTKQFGEHKHSEKSLWQPGWLSTHAPTWEAVPVSGPFPVPAGHPPFPHPRAGASPRVSFLLRGPGQSVVVAASCCLQSPPSKQHDLHWNTYLKSKDYKYKIKFRRHCTVWMLSAYLSIWSKSPLHNKCMYKCLNVI